VPNGIASDSFFRAEDDFSAATKVTFDELKRRAQIVVS
jgi:hypothetical protein